MSPNHPLSLAELEQALAQWRSHRQGRSIPSWIRAQAVALLGQHRASEIQAVLGINHGMLKRWQADTDRARGADPVEPLAGFVTLPPWESSQGKEPREGALALTLSRQARDGSSVSVSGTLSWAQWHQALRLLTAEEALG